MNTIKLKDGSEFINIIDHSFLEGLIGDVELYTLILDKSGNILYTSDNHKNFEYDNFLDKKISERLSKKAYIKLRKMMLETMFTNKKVIDTILYKNRLYKILISPIFYNNDVNIKIIKYLVINGYDCTRENIIQEEFDELKKKLDMSNSVKSVFLSNISHELRTPMNSIIGFSDILLQNGLSKSQREKFIKSINSNAKHLDELLNNIIDSSRLDSGDFDILYENFSISELFEDLNDIFKEVNYTENLDLVKLDFIIDEDKKIICDYLRLKQVLSNLISNSIKFTDLGSITISFEIINDFIVFSVKDTGIGIPEDKINHVFERFWQTDSSSTKKHKGVGLGLSISKSIIDNLDGKIWLDSIENKGTTFFIKIPLEEIKHDILVEKNGKITFSGKTILIIDELPVEYSLLGMYLNSFKIDILTSYKGDEAIKLFKEHKSEIDSVIIDLNLPDINSYKLCKKLKNINQDIKIISKCVNNTKSNVLIDYHLQKPINKEKLLLILNKIWQK